MHRVEEARKEAAAPGAPPTSHRSLCCQSAIFWQMRDGWDPRVAIIMRCRARLGLGLGLALPLQRLTADAPRVPQLVSVSCRVVEHETSSTALAATGRPCRASWETQNSSRMEYSYVGRGWVWVAREVVGACGDALSDTCSECAREKRPDPLCRCRCSVPRRCRSESYRKQQNALPGWVMGSCMRTLLRPPHSRSYHLIFAERPACTVGFARCTVLVPNSTQTQAWSFSTKVQTILRVCSFAVTNFSLRVSD